MKKIYYMSYQTELIKADGSFVQFLDAAKAVHVNRLHFTEDPKLAMMKVYYEFVHAQRNEESHNAPVVADEEVNVGLHMVMAMYLYATLINITEMEGMTEGYQLERKEDECTWIAANDSEPYCNNSERPTES